MIHYAKNALLLLSGLLISLPGAFGQSQSSHVGVNPPHMRTVMVPAFRAPVGNSFRSSTSSRPRPIIVRMPAPPAPHRGTSSVFSQAASGGDSVTFIPNSVFPSGAFADLNNLGPFLNTNTPGLGFDFPHLAALNHDLGVRAIIDPVTQHELAISEQLLNRERGAATASAFIPFFGGADYSEPVAYQQQPPQIIVLQQPAQQTQPEEETAPPATSAAPEEPPLPPVGEFVLVLRSGKQIKAVAFTHQDDVIVYVTADGARNSFPIAELDVAATEQINQQHGTPLKLSL